jgi:hypothetical protein
MGAYDRQTRVPVVQRRVKTLSKNGYYHKYQDFDMSMQLLGWR